MSGVPDSKRTDKDDSNLHALCSYTLVVLIYLEGSKDGHIEPQAGDNSDESCHEE